MDLQDRPGARETVLDPSPPLWQIIYARTHWGINEDAVRRIRHPPWINSSRQTCGKKASATLSILKKNTLYPPWVNIIFTPEKNHSPTKADSQEEKADHKQKRDSTPDTLSESPEPRKKKRRDAPNRQNEFPPPTLGRSRKTGVRKRQALDRKRFNTGTPERLQLGAKSSVTDFFSIDLAADWEAMGDSSFWSVVEAALDPIFPNEDGHPRPSDDRNHSPPLSVGQRSMPTHHHIKEKQERTATRNGNAYFIAHMTPGPPVIVDSVVPAWKRLISDTLLPQELISLIEEIFVNKDEVKAISGLLGDDAQVFINTIHKALVIPGLLPRFRKKCLRALYRICGRQALLPKSLQIPVCYNQLAPPLYRGGFADVWKGEHEGRHVAVKVLRVYSTRDVGKITSRFCKEVVVWNALCHPNVLPLLGIMMDKDRFAMISEWMVNGNISEFTRVHWEANPFELLKEVTDGLTYIHTQGMIHGDLKGVNILVDQDGHARLADFGLLTIISDQTGLTTSSSPSTGGTTRWMSPELLHPERFGYDNGCRPTKESDCYALGMVIYEVLTGQPPFPGLRDHIIIRIVPNGERPGRPEGVKGTWFTDDLWKMLGLCWSTDTQSRPSIESVRECLERVSSTWKPIPPQANEDVEQQESDWNLITLTP